MKTRFLILLVFLIYPVLSGCGQVSEKNPENKIKKETLKKQIYFLASDELMGRNTGSEEIKKAAHYIADYFKSIGVKELPGATNYLQAVPLKISEPAKKCDLEIGNSHFKNGGQLVLRAGDKLATEATIVFVPQNLWNEQGEDEGSIEMKNKFIITELGADPNMGFGEIMMRSERRKQIVNASGGIALIEIYDHSASWSRLAPYLNRSSMELDFTSAGTSKKELTHIWINITDQELVEGIRKGEIQSTTINSDGKAIQRFNDQNVVGYIPGTDPQLKDEYLLLTAHYDHLGAGLGKGRSATPEDSIFNGAGDNAMGTVAVMGAAKAFSETPGKRSVIFLALTGEEKGLLGSKYFAENPLVPLQQIVFNLNNDGGGMADSDIINILGLNRTGTSDLVISACEEFGLSVNADESFEFLFNASDNVSFASKGIPCMTFSPGFRVFSQEVPEHYHRPSDEPGTIDYDYYVKFVRAYAKATRNIANRKVRPMWIPGDAYEQVGKELYKLENQEATE